MKTLRLTIITTLLLLLSTQLIFAQSKADSSAKIFHFKRYALQFSVTDFLKFAGYEGSALSLKYHFNDRSALRIGISTEFGNSTNDLKNKDSQDSLASTTHRDNDSYRFTINIPYLYYVHPQKSIKLYLGFGPSFSYEYAYSESRQLSLSSSYNTQKSTRYVYGILALSGVEWFFHSNMSLSLQYGLRLSYFDKHQTTNKKYLNQSETRSEKITADYSGWMLSPKTIYLGLSLYL